jgi:SAM-dependent methyltransferase
MRLAAGAGAGDGACENRPVVSDYRAVNRGNWDERAPAHAKSPDYAVARFEQDPTYLSHVVRFDLPLLGDIRGQRGVHLQCHIGTDTVSLARLGAKMSGLDFSSAALEQARRLASATGAEIDFVEADLYDAVDALGGGRFDLVYTGIGAICWLPDIERWADRLLELEVRVVDDEQAILARLVQRPQHRMALSDEQAAARRQQLRHDGTLIFHDRS